MRKWKLFAVLLLFALLSAVLFGCVQSVSVTQFLDGVGGFHREILVTYDVNAEDAQTTQTRIKNVMMRYVEQSVLSDYAEISEETAGEVLLDLSFSSLDEYYIWLGYTGREENEVETPTKKGVVNAYDRTLDSYLTERNVDMVRSLADEDCRDFTLDAAFYYTYGTTNRSTISNGERSEKDGVYYHTWRLDPENPSEMKIRIYGLSVVAVYLIAISIFVLSLAIIFAIIYFNRRKEKKRAVAPHDSPRLSEEIFPIAKEEEKE